MQLSDTLSIVEEVRMVMPRLAVLYAHLLACCLAVGITLAADITALRRIATGVTTERRHADFQTLQSTVVLALWGLWITGTAIVLIDVSMQGLVVLSNPKLQSKIAVVSILTINGMFLHRYAIPVLTEAGSLLNMKPDVQIRVLASGVLSGVSWVYATFLGLARPLSWKYSVAELMTPYLLIVLLAFSAFYPFLNFSTRKVKRSSILATENNY